METQPEKSLHKVLSYLDDEKVCVSVYAAGLGSDIVVVGLPVNMDGSEMEMTRRARKFGNRINGRFGYKIAFMDERLTTREAKAEAATQGHRGNYRNNPIDASAARLILESWMTQN